MGLFRAPALLLCLLLLVWPSSKMTLAKVQSKVHCSEEDMAMSVEVSRPDNKSLIYLKGLKFYPDEKCRPLLEENKATFRLSLSDVFQCGISRIVNEKTGTRVYLHSVVVEQPGGEVPKELLSVKCVLAPGLNSTAMRNRRNVLPAGFQEDEFVAITRSFEERAPEPKLSVGVTQGGQEVTGELNVNPGTPLEMTIFLNKESAPVYGLLVSYMQVTDTKSQEETIIFNGCSVDPYLFENFNTVDGDSLTAKFRAFKFPESTYVQFKGTVSVCLDKCRGVQCSNGQMGFGRRRREVSAMAADPNKVFEVTMSTFIKVDYKDGDEQALIEKDLLALIRPRNNGSRVTVQESNSLPESEGQHNLNFRTERIQEQFHYTIIDDGNSASAICSSTWLLFSVIAVLVAGWTSS